MKQKEILKRLKEIVRRYDEYHQIHDDMEEGGFILENKDADAIRAAFDKIAKLEEKNKKLKKELQIFYLDEFHRRVQRASSSLKLKKQGGFCHETCKDDERPEENR